MLNFAFTQRCIVEFITKMRLSRNVVFLYLKVVCISIIAKLSCFQNQTPIVCMSVYITSFLGMIWD